MTVVWLMEFTLLTDFDTGGDRVDGDDSTVSHSLLEVLNRTLTNSQNWIT